MAGTTTYILNNISTTPPAEPIWMTIDLKTYAAVVGLGALALAAAVPSYGGDLYYDGKIIISTNFVSPAVIAVWDGTWAMPVNLNDGTTFIGGQGGNRQPQTGPQAIDFDGTTYAIGALDLNGNPAVFTSTSPKTSWAPVIVEASNSFDAIQALKWIPRLNLWIAVGDKIWTSPAGGATWTNRNAVDSFYSQIYDDGTTLWVIGTTKVFKSTDGITWIDQVFPANYPHMVSFPSPLWYSSRLNLWVGIANKGGASADPHNGIVWSPAPDQAWTYGYTSAADPPAVPADDFVAITEVGGLLYMVGTRVTATSPLSQEALIAASSDGKGWGATIPVLPEVPSFMSATIFAIIGAPDDIGIGIGLRNTNALDVLTNAYSADGGVTLTNQHLGGHFQQIIPFATTPTPAGDLIGFTFNEEQGVTAWHRHPMVGGVRAIACIPNPSKSQDDLWMIVQRSINGVTKQYVEYMAPHFVTGDDLATDAFYSDSGTTYNGAATQTITGLGYLEGQTVKVLTDGALHPDCVVTGGQISLQWPAKIVQIGLPQLARLTTMPIEAGATTGSAAGKVKRITDLTVRFQNTLGGKIGREDPDKELSDPPESIFDNVEMRDPDDPMSQALTVYNGLWPEETYAFNFPAGYEVEGRITMLNDEPYPMTVVGIYPNLDSED